MPETAPSLPVAKITDRFLAYLLDLAPFFFGGYATLYVLIVRARILSNTVPAWRKVAGAWIGLYLLYQALGNVSGGTLGKRLLGLKVAGSDGGPLGPARSILRSLGYLLSTPLANLGFILALFDARSRALHDRLAGSVVLEERAKRPGAALASALLSLAALLALGGVNLWQALLKPTPADQEAVRKAREGLRILAAMEEAYREREGRYSDRLADLAKTSGDVAEFKAAMGELFDPYGFRIAAGPGAYRLEGRAKDSRRSVVSLEGPLAAR